MKLSLTLTVVALASAVSASPLPFLSPSEISTHRPCRGSPSPSALLNWIKSRTGLLPRPQHPHLSHLDVLMGKTKDSRTEDLLTLVEPPSAEEQGFAAKQDQDMQPQIEIIYIEDLDALQPVGSIEELEDWEMLESKPYFSKHKHHLEGPHGHKHHHDHQDHHTRRHGSFSRRVGHALSLLNNSELLILTFVLGAGIGSLFHLIFMVFLVSYRYASGDRRTRAERRAERTSESQNLAEGQIRLDEKEEIVSPPQYEERQGRLVAPEEL